MLANEFLNKQCLLLILYVCENVNCSKISIPRVELNALMVAKGIPLKAAMVEEEEEEEGHDEM